MTQKITFFLLLSLFLGFSNCDTPSTPTTSVSSTEAITTDGCIQEQFVHAVYFWLKNPDNQEDRKTFETAIHKLIESSKYIKAWHLGVPAMSDREVVDNSYTYSYVVSFDSKEDEAKYQVEDVHLQFIDEAGHVWERVQVYDSIFF